MKPGARLAACVDILNQLIARKGAADVTLSAWARANRYAGSKDRAAIAERVYTVLRRRNECAWLMGADTPRALTLGSLKIEDGLSVEQIAALCGDGTYALGALTEGEVAALSRDASTAPLWARHNYPQWLEGSLQRRFGDKLEVEMAALNARAPLDLRVNTLKVTRDQASEALTEAGIEHSFCERSPVGLRIASGRQTKLLGLPCYLNGWIEVQDEGSQLAVLASGASPGETVVDLAAGAGGKSLALAAMMGDRGRIISCDVDARRLLEMEPRLLRSGARAIEYAGDPYSDFVKSQVGTGCDLVFVDAPCSGTGTWRRNPESKWRLSAEYLQAYAASQRQLLERAAELSGLMGRIVYAVCSILPEEGEDRMAEFESARPEWRCVETQFFSPAQHGTDGFFVGVLKRRTS